MSTESRSPITELEILGGDDAAVCGPAGCELPPTSLEEQPPPPSRPEVAPGSTL